MDRDKRWDRVERAYNAMVLGGENYEVIALSIKEEYDNKITDEFMTQNCCYGRRRAVASIEDGDSVIFFNFRPDRRLEKLQEL